MDKATKLLIYTLIQNYNNIPNKFNRLYGYEYKMFFNLLVMEYLSMGVCQAHQNHHISPSVPVQM